MKSYQDFVVISDMDGTLIGSNHQVSEKNKAAIRYFTEQGGSFAVASGRTQHNSVPYMAGITVNMPCIFYNGGVLFDWQAQQLMKTHAIESPVLLEFVQNCQKICPKMCIQVYTEDRFYVVTDPQHDDEVMLSEKQVFDHADLEKISAEPWIKILLCDEKENLLKCRTLSEDIGLSRVTNNFFSSPVYLEFVAKDVSKGTMLTELLQMDAYRGKTVVAAGDFHNDIEMLRRADCGVAPLTAQPEVLAVADIISVSHDEDLLHHIIYKIVPSMF